MISIDVNEGTKSAKVNRDSSNAQMELGPVSGRYGKVCICTQKFGEGYTLLSAQK